MSTAHIQNGLKKGTLIQGAFSVSAHNVLEATIVGEVEGKSQTVFILGRKHFNRCINGDIVAVELLPKSEWKRGASIAIENEEDEEKMNGDEMIEEESKKMETDDLGQPEPTGKVVGIIRKKWRPYCGFIDKKSIPSTINGNAPLNVTFRALDRCIPPIKIRTSQAANLVGKRIVVNIDSWPITSG